MKKRPILSFILIVGGMCLAAWFSYAAYKEAKRNRQIDQEINSIRGEAERIRKDNTELQDKVSYFETPQFQELIAKEKLNLQKGGENVAIIKSSPSLNSTEAPATEEKKPDVLEIHNYQKWWNKFFGY